jgi:hypothetical protein
MSSQFIFIGGICKLYRHIASMFWNTLDKMPQCSSIIKCHYVIVSSFDDH